MWLYTPFLASMLAFCAPSAWWLLRNRFGAAAPLAAAGSVLVALPALVYAYALMGAIKEITLLPIILALLAIVMLWRRWLGGPVAAVLPVAVIAAAGLGVVGLAFAAWIAVAAVVLLAAAVTLIARERSRLGPLALQIARRPPTARGARVSHRPRSRVLADARHEPEPVQRGGGERSRQPAAADPVDPGLRRLAGWQPPLRSP